MADETSSSSSHEALFLQMVAMFHMAALQHMGKLVNPVTNEVERNLEQAKISIDLLEMIQARTAGNRTNNEEAFLKKTLFELHMNYVDEVNKPEEEPEQAESNDVDSPGEVDSSGEVDPEPGEPDGEKDG